MFLEFLSNYWQYICFGVMLILDLLILFLKKNKTDVIDNGLHKKLMDWIREAEIIWPVGFGESKMDYVLDCFKSYYSKADSSTLVLIKSFVEEILSLPSKKGDFYGAEKKIKH